jgi:hypothetical protein
MYSTLCAFLSFDDMYLFLNCRRLVAQQQQQQLLQQQQNAARTAAAVATPFSPYVHKLRLY